MLVKELRQGLRTRGFVGTFIVFQALMAFVMLGVVTSAGSDNQSVRAMSLNTANVFFWALLSLQLLIFTPGRALGGLQMESDMRTLDLLLLTRLDAWRIVIGKWSSLLVQAVLLLIAMLPYGIVRYFAGSVDLMADARICCVLLGGSALLTAAGLWGAGMGKVFRLLGLVLMVLTSSVGSSMFSAFTRGRFAMSTPDPGAVVLIALDGGMVLVFFLVAAVRNIAPPAENHALLARSLPLVALAGVPLALVFRESAQVIQSQLIFSGGFLMVVSAVELASLQLPMFVHWHRWRTRASLPRVVFRMTLPGWPSALLFATTAAMLWVFCAAVLDVTHKGFGAFVWPAVLGLSAVTFPSLLMSFFVRAPRSPGGVYGLFVGAGIILAVLGMVIPQSYPRLESIRDFVSVLPVSSFIMAVFGGTPAVAAVFVQGVIAVLVLGFAWAQSRHYWHVLTSLELRDRLSKP